MISTLWLWDLGSLSFFKQLIFAFLDFDFKVKVFDLPQALLGLFFGGQCLSHFADTFGALFRKNGCDYIFSVRGTS